MVRQECDSEKLRALRAELEKHTALLPAVLQSTDCVALVDHLTCIFKDDDWQSSARCSQSLHNDASAHQSGWSNFQDLLRHETQSADPQTELQAMDRALATMQANIQSIQATTCLPPSRLAALASASGRDSNLNLETVRCTVCHSLLLTAAFDDHLPSCRPCPPQTAAAARRTKSSTSQPSSSGRPASKPAAARGGKAGKKGRGKGSKPPAGPSRFAIEQAKPLPQQQPIPTKSSDDSDLHMMPSHPSLHQPHKAGQPLPHASLPSTSLLADHAHPSGVKQQPSVVERQSDAGDGDGGDAMRWSQKRKRSRNAWSYQEHMSRSNPRVDAVHDPSLPPRFPQNATRNRTTRSASAGPAPFRLSEYGSASAHSGNQVQLPSGGGHLIGLSDCTLPDAALPHRPDRHSSAHYDETDRAKRQRQADPTPGLVLDSQISAWQQQSQLHGQQRRTHNSLAVPAGFEMHASQLRTSEDNLHRQSDHMQCQQDTPAMHGSLAATSSQLQSQPAQGGPLHHAAWRPQQHSASWQHPAYQDATLISLRHPALKPKQGLHAPPRSFNVPAAHSMQPSANGAAANGLHHPNSSTTGGMQQRSANMPSGYTLVKTRNSVHADDDTSSPRVAQPGSWRMPESKRQVSVNALARTPLGT